MYFFVNGVIAMGCGVAAVFFQRLARKTSDSLFVYFAIAFALLALERIVLTVVQSPEESSAAVYTMRLAAFLCIIFAIIRKNVPTRRR